MSPEAPECAQQSQVKLQVKGPESTASLPLKWEAGESPKTVLGEEEGDVGL